MDATRTFVGLVLAGCLTLASGGWAGEDAEGGVITGNLGSWRTVSGTAPLARVFEFLEKADLSTLPLGRTEIEGDEIFALVSEYETRTPDTSRFEAHRTHIDVQLVVSGQETIGHAAVDTLETTTPYDGEKDIEFFATPASSTQVPLMAGQFAVFAPRDGHMPGVRLDGPHAVRKIVVKVRVPRATAH